MKQSTGFSLKDKIFNQSTVAALGQRIQAIYSEFDIESFLKHTEQAFPECQLKECIQVLAESLHHLLPKDYPIAIAILINSLPEELNPDANDNDFGDFIDSCYSHYIALYGCQAEYLEQSLEALAEITKRFSAEFAIRAFINKFPTETLAFLNRCSLNNNYHIRRLASEGTRPKLPWAEKIVISEDCPLPILHNLAADPTRFVTRSVANHLNDISKSSPDLVLQTLRKWREEKKNTALERSYIAKHALRTLLKQGHSETLQFLGYQSPALLSKTSLSLSSAEISLGEHLDITFCCQSNLKQNLLIHYIIYYTDKSGKATRKAVFHWKNTSAEKQNELSLKKRLTFRLLSTRSLYSGLHRISVQVNGTEILSKDFLLRIP